MPVYMNSGKIVADGWTGGRGFEGSTRGPRGPKNNKKYLWSKELILNSSLKGIQYLVSNLVIAVT